MCHGCGFRDNIIFHMDCGALQRRKNIIKHGLHLKHLLFIYCTDNGSRTKNINNSNSNDDDDDDDANNDMENNTIHKIRITNRELLRHVKLNVSNLILESLNCDSNQFSLDELLNCSDWCTQLYNSKVELLN